MKSIRNIRFFPTSSSSSSSSSHLLDSASSAISVETQYFESEQSKHFFDSLFRLSFSFSSVFLLSASSRCLLFAVIFSTAACVAAIDGISASKSKPSRIGTKDTRYRHLGTGGENLGLEHIDGEGEMRRRGSGRGGGGRGGDKW